MNPGESLSRAPLLSRALMNKIETIQNLPKQGGCPLFYYCCSRVSLQAKRPRTKVRKLLCSTLFEIPPLQLKTTPPYIRITSQIGRVWWQLGPCPHDSCPPQKTHQVKQKIFTFPYIPAKLITPFCLTLRYQDARDYHSGRGLLSSWRGNPPFVS